MTQVAYFFALDKSFNEGIQTAENLEASSCYTSFRGCFSGEALGEPSHHVPLDLSFSWCFRLSELAPSRLRTPLMRACEGGHWQAEGVASFPGLV